MRAIARSVAGGTPSAVRSAFTSVDARVSEREEELDDALIFVCVYGELNGTSSAAS